ncbi:MAG TPA: hypothetical protein VFC44_06325 [Candidatus Saccharimonadales bacterium]|nr:hypothetical protein [Candidatus Saccharimonadales bacterium]
MFEKFGLEFRVFTKDLEAATPSGNPFEDIDHLIVRLDQMARNDDLQEKLCAAGWDLVVFDEAHKLAAHFFGSKLEKTGRFKLAEKLGAHSRVYLPPTSDAMAVATAASPTWRPDLEFFQQALGFRVGNYGITKWSELFTQRQLMAMTTLCDLVAEARGRIRRDAMTAELGDDETNLESGGTAATAYAEAVSVYLGMATSRWADFCNTICSWNEQNQNIRVLFARQAIPMSWDFAELSPFSSVGPWFSVVESIVAALPATAPNNIPGRASQENASTQTLSRNKTVSTDPPYFDNIGYADLSDFFYVWLRKSLHSILPSLLATTAVPKSEELVATPARHGSKERAEKFFLDGMTKAMASLADQAHPAGPITIYYAFKQSDTDSESGTASSGCETFLEAVSRASLQLSGTWPMGS